MESWELDFEWLKVRHIVKGAMNKDHLPDLQTVLFLIGIQELGSWPKENFTKEEKKDLMHVAVCTLLEPDGYYVFEGRDQDGWPHWKENSSFTIKGVQEQEKILVQNIIKYFKEYNEIDTFTL
ncbi:MAG: hypothetical protein IPL63_16720 [Saprospiraceae bacterium]|nr:hypothetical protein [Saprospiraceae bacterium]MBK6784773.1 hypothetical protein [Saprospiraceae bacterium]MBK7523343.1 hypothetical protein [Saprospiraceae bacterium]MBK8079444.1 hypothetical protein [Saprospiraceae bacterium]MBK8371664.1 hypothetical protein [Saprospiraceae bacterium]